MPLAACALILGMTLMICADVLLRNVRIVPGMAGLEWANEISEAMLYLITLLTAPWLMRQGQHIRVDIVLRAVPKPVGWAFEWLVDVLALACCAVIAYYGARAALASWTAGSMSIKTLVTPEWWLLSVAAGRLPRAHHRDAVPHAAAVRSGRARRAMTRFPPGDVVAGRGVADARGLDGAAVPRAAGGVLLPGDQPDRRARSSSAARPGLTQLARNSVGSVASFSLTPIPLFILMGEVLFHTGLAVKVIDGVERLIRQVPGRLAVVAVVAGTVFSAISGSTIATTAMLGSLMLPVMLARGYHPTMATGPLMAIGAVDMLIPPSALTVLLGSLSGISISKLLIGGVMPGLVLSLAFVVYIVVRVKLNPALAPASAFTEYRGWQKLQPVRAVRDAAGVDLRGGGRPRCRPAGRRRPSRRRSARSPPCVLALAYRSLTLEQSPCGAARHGGDLRHDPVHHRRRHHLLADPVVLGREQRAGRADRRARACRRWR